jgi:hypothetical protein
LKEPEALNRIPEKLNAQRMVQVRQKAVHDRPPKSVLKRLLDDFRWQVSSRVKLREQFFAIEFLAEPESQTPFQKQASVRERASPGL